MILTLSGCGGGGGGSNTATTDNKIGIAQLGNLAKAQVKIYKIEDNGTKTLLWSETTSDGATLDDIGNFNTHSEELNDSTYYLYEVKGGEDWDSDDNGVKDASGTTNQGKIRAIIRGNKLKALSDRFRVTAISEILYEKVAKELKYHFNKNTFETVLEEKAKTIIPNGSPDDIYTFNPVNDKNNLNELYRLKFQTIADTIHNVRYPLLTLSSILGSYDTAGDASGMTLSSDGTKAYVADGDDGLAVIDITLFD